MRARSKGKKQVIATSAKGDKRNLAEVVGRAQRVCGIGVDLGDMAEGCDQLAEVTLAAVDWKVGRRSLTCSVTLPGLRFGLV